MKTIVRLSLAMVIITALLLTSCGPKPTEAPEATTPPEPKEEVTLVFWSCWNPGEPQAEAQTKWAEGFEKETGIKVEVVFNGRENQTKLRTALAAGTKVDLMDQDAYQVAGGLVAEKMGYAVDEWLDEDAWGESGRPFRDIFYPGLLEQYQLEGKTYLIPHTLITPAFWYDKRDFRAAGVEEPPKTWDEFLDVCEKINATGVACIAQDAAVGMYDAFWFYHLVERMKGPGFLLAAAEDKTGEKWGDPVFLKAAQMERELWDKGYIIEGAEGFTWPQGQMTMAEDAAAMELCGSWLPNELKDAVAPEFEWGGFVFPAVEGGEGKRTDMEAYMMSYMILKDAPHPREAFDFIRYTLTNENMELWKEITLSGLPRKDMEWPDIIADGSGMFKEATVLFDGFDGIGTKHAEYYANVLLPRHQEMFLGSITPEEFVEKMKAETVTYWETH
jgi:raffinose/stachyose/melibiose transport system substrate-binding protein